MLKRILTHFHLILHSSSSTSAKILPFPRTSFDQFTNMKLTLFFVALVASPALAATTSGRKTSHQNGKRSQNESEKPNIVDFDSLKTIPGFQDLLDSAAKHGSSEQQTKEDVEKLVSSPGMAALMEDMDQQMKRGDTLDDILDSAIDTIRGKEPRDAKQPPNDTIKECIDKCVNLKTQQCFYLQDKNVSKEGCENMEIRRDCKKSCTKL